MDLLTADVALGQFAKVRCWLPPLASAWATRSAAVINSMAPRSSRPPSRRELLLSYRFRGFQRGRHKPRPVDTPLRTTDRVCKPLVGETACRRHWGAESVRWSIQSGHGHVAVLSGRNGRDRQSRAEFSERCYGSPGRASLLLPAEVSTIMASSVAITSVTRPFHFFGAHSKNVRLMGGCLQTPAYTCSSPEVASDSDSHQ